MLYSCTRTATVGVKGLMLALSLLVCRSKLTGEREEFSGCSCGQKFSRSDVVCNEWRHDGADPSADKRQSRIQAILSAKQIKCCTNDGRKRNLMNHG